MGILKDRGVKLPDDGGGDQGGIMGNVQGLTEFLNPAKALPGLANFAGGVATDTFDAVIGLPLATAGSVYARATGQDERELAEDIRNTPILRELVAEEALEGGSFTERARRTIPTFTEAAASIESTPGRVHEQITSFAPGGQAPSETAYGQAWKRGELAPVLLEDIGNLSIVAGGAGAAMGRAAGVTGKAGTAARLAGKAGRARGISRATEEAIAKSRAPGLARTGQKLTRAAMLGDVASDAPFTVWQGAGKLAGKVAGDTPLGRSLSQQGFTRTALKKLESTERGGRMIGGVKRGAAKRGIYGYGRGAAQQRGLATSDQTINMKQAAPAFERLSKLDQPTQQATIAQPSLVPETLRPILDELPESERARFLSDYRRQFPQGLTEEALLATPDVDTARALDEAYYTPEAQRYVAGEGMMTDLEPAQRQERIENLSTRKQRELGFELTDPIETTRRRVERMYAEELQEFADAERRAEGGAVEDPGEAFQQSVADMAARKQGMRVRRRRGADVELDDATRAEFEADIDRMMEDPMNAPARFRPMLQAGKWADEWVNREVDTNANLSTTQKNRLREVAAELPATVEQAYARGLDPEYVPGDVVAAGQIDLQQGTPDGLTEALNVSPDAAPDVVRRLAERQQLRDTIREGEGGLGSVDAKEAQASLQEMDQRLSAQGIDPDRATAALENWMRETSTGRVHASEGVSYRLEEANARPGRTSTINREGLPAERELRETKTKRAQAMPSSEKDLAQTALRRWHDQMENKALRGVIESMGTDGRRLGVDLYGNDLVDAVNQRARRARRANLAGGGRLIEPWDEMVPFDPQGKAQVTRHELVGPETPFLPKSAVEFLKNEARLMDLEKNLSAAETAYRKGTSAFKAGALALSPKWYQGNIAGGMFMSTMGTGHVPGRDWMRDWQDYQAAKELAEIGEKSPHLIREGGLEVGARKADLRMLESGKLRLDEAGELRVEGTREVTPGMIDRGEVTQGGRTVTRDMIERGEVDVRGYRVNPEARHMFNPHPDTNMARRAQGLEERTPSAASMSLGRRLQDIGDIEGGTVRSRLSKAGAAIEGEGVVGAGFGLNELQDNVFKSMAYLNEQRKRLAEGDLQASEKAVSLALDALPDFRQTAWEARIRNRYVPFLPWLKHVTKTAWRLSRDHPVRVLWTMELANLFYPEEGAEDFSWLMGMVPFGETSEGKQRFLPLGNLNPYQGVVPYDAITEALSGGSPAAPVARSLNPVGKLAVEAATGFDLARGTLTGRPDETLAVDEMGRAVGRLLITDPRGLLYKAANLTPQTRALRDVWKGDVARYDTGEPIMQSTEVMGHRLSEPISTDTSIADRAAENVLSYLTPWPRDYDVEAMREARDARLSRINR